MQANHNYTYLVTAMGTDPESESMHSNQNEGWQNYCFFPTCQARRDPEGRPEQLVCGDEHVMLQSPQGEEIFISQDGLWSSRHDPHPASTEVAPHRIIGYPQIMCEECGGGGQNGGGGWQELTYDPPARFVFYHLDHLGSPRVIMNAYGHVVETHHYLPFGEELPASEITTLNTRAFTGHERDSETGLDYMLARYYSSSLGRFMAVDPGDDTALEDPQSWNKYGYVRNNPLKYSDPEGESPTLVTAGIGLGIGFVAGAIGEIVSQVTSGEEINLQDIGASAVGGAITGGLVGLTGGLSLVGSTIVGAAVTGAGAAVVGGAVERGIDSSDATSPLDPKAAAADAAGGALGGAVGGAAQQAAGKLVKGAKPATTELGRQAAKHAPKAAKAIGKAVGKAVGKKAVKKPQDEADQKP